MTILLLLGCQSDDVDGGLGSIDLSIIGSTSTFLSLSFSDVNAVAWADVDRDGWLDVALAIDGQNRIYLNGGDGTFAYDWTSVASFDSRDVAWGDVDGDGYPELAFANHDGSVEVHDTDSGGVETTASMLTGGATGSTDVAWGDVDGDGDLDLGAVYDGSIVHVYETLAAGPSWTSMWSPPIARDARDLAFADFDGERDVDLALANYADFDAVYENDEGLPSADPCFFANEGTWCTFDQSVSSDLAWASPTAATGAAPTT